MKRGMKITLTLAIVLAICSASASAEIFTVELPEFLGTLDESTYMKTTTFDFGTSFFEIYDVSIQLEGTCTFGSAHGDGVWIPEDEWTDVHPHFGFAMDPPDGLCGVGVIVEESPFVIDEPLGLLFGATWDFLLDGTDHVTLDFNWGFGIDGWVIVTTPTADITEAYLIVDGIVPEPATILLFAIGAIAIRIDKGKC
jgi:hypothetical protein